MKRMMCVVGALLIAAAWSTTAFAQTGAPATEVDDLLKAVRSEIAGYSLTGSSLPCHHGRDGIVDPMYDRLL